MHKKFLQTARLLSSKVKTFTRTKPDIGTYGTALTSRASEVTAGANGMSTECETTYKVYTGS